MVPSPPGVRLAAAFAVLSLAALLLVPLGFQNAIESTRGDIATIAEPARQATSDLQLAHSLAVAAIRAYSLTGDAEFLEDYRHGQEVQREALGRVARLMRVPPLDARAAVDAARRASDDWSSVNDQVALGTVGRVAFVASLPEQQERFRTVLTTTASLRGILVTFAAERRARIQQLERIRTGVQLLLTLLAAGSAAAVLHLSGGLRAQTALARTDALTGLFNRRAFLEAVALELKRAARSGNPVTLAYFDVDDFKAVNDGMGHAAGDRLLRDVARAIGGTVRGVDIAARLGGDEFAVLLAAVDRGSPAAAVRRVRDALSHDLNARGWRVTLSVGSVTVSGEMPAVETLVSHADQLMYAVKRSGKNAMRHETIAEASPPEGAGASRPPRTSPRA